MSGLSDDFARAFGDALKAHLDNEGIDYAKAAPRLGIRKQTLSTYWTDDKEGKRKKPRAEVLYLACVELNFKFEYKGYKVMADTLGVTSNDVRGTSEQLSLDFSRQFNLTEDRGQLLVSLKRRTGNVELSVSLRAAS
jgi:hypothetical protein